jgi:putative membrane protein
LGREDIGGGDAVMWWNDGWGAWWFVMPLVMIGFWVAVIWVVVNLLQNRPGPTPTGRARPATPEEILAQRYARGEIDDDEYHRRLDTLRDAHPRAGQ